MGLYLVAVFNIARQQNTIQYSTIQYNNITESDKMTYSCQPSILKSTKNILYTVKTQERLEPKLDESVLKNAVYTTQTVNHTV
jgi:hypothetical protein